MSAFTWFLLGMLAGALLLSVVAYVSEFVGLLAVKHTPLPVPQRPPTERERAALMLVQGRAFECGCPVCTAERQRGGLN